MAAGDVYFCKNFQFKDGGIADKLLVALNDVNCSGFANLLVCKTTSQQKHRKLKEGCHDGYFFFPQNKELFKRDTWIIFELYEIKLDSLLKDAFDKRIQTIGKLKDQSLKAILNCISKSDDISGFHMDVINGMRKKR